jgi:MFS transporter, NNP family, nitrate/nitrite transporter
MAQMHVSEEGVPFRQAFPTVLFVVSVSVIFFVGRSGFAPLLLDVEEAFRVGHAESSRLMMTFTAGYSLSMFFSGLVSQYITHRRLIPLAAALGAAGMIILALAPAMVVMNVGLVVFGVGFGLFVPTAISMITTAVERKDWSRAFSVNEMSPHIGMILAPLIVAAARPILSWRWMFALVGLSLITGAFLFAGVVRQGRTCGRAPNLDILGQLVRRKEFWVLIAFFGLSLAGTDGVYLLIPTFLVTEGGVEPRLANAVFGVSRFMPLIALFAAAVLFDRIRPSLLMALALAGQGVALVLLGLTAGWIRLVVVFLQPAIGALYFPAGFAALASLMPPDARNVGVSLTLPTAVFLGVGVIPSVVGYMGEHFTFAAGFVGLGLVMIILSFLSFTGQFSRRRV